MGKPISLFPRYSQKENRITNYILLVLKMLNDANTSYFSEVISGLIGQEVHDCFGIKFEQQQGGENSVPDGSIYQSASNIIIETKTGNSFDVVQLKNHLEYLSEEKSGLRILFALGNFDRSDDNQFKDTRILCKTKYKGGITFKAITFEELLLHIRRCEIPRNLSDVVDELEFYLNEEGCLPSWKNKLDVINCSQTQNDVLNSHAYICPATTGPYSHKRSRFFGMYADMKVQRIAEINAVVDIISDKETKMLWNNTKDLEDVLIKEAKNIYKKYIPNKYPKRIFLLGILHKTNFKKGDKNPMQCSKQYFDISCFNVKNAEELSKKLNEKKWSDVLGTT